MNYGRATGLDAAALALRCDPQCRVLAGGQSLIAAMKLGMVEASHLVDLQSLPELQRIVIEANQLVIGAMATHHQVATSEAVQAFCPMLSELAGGIADQQVRHRGTLGGSLAHNDPAACWPTAVLALNATIVTTERDIEAADFFVSVYTTALRQGEIIRAVRFAKPRAAHYIKFEQPASRFALVGVVVARTVEGSRVAITGLGHGVVRWRGAEASLDVTFSQHALNDISTSELDATTDLHASAAYRIHLSRVLTRRAVAAILGEATTPLPTRNLPSAKTANVPANAVARPAIGGRHLIAAPLDTVWRALLDPVMLRRCIPGCDSMEVVDSSRYVAHIKVGLGPISATFQSRIRLFDAHPPIACRIEFEGDAGALGRGGGVASVALSGTPTSTQIDWSATTQLSGRLAQLGARLTQATAKKLAAEFFATFARNVSNDPPSKTTWWQRLWKRLFRS